VFLEKKRRKRSWEVRLSVIGETAAGRLDFLFAQDFAEGCVTLGAFKEADFKLHAFALFVGSSGHFPSFLGLRDVSSTFWTFCHFVSSVICVASWFLMMVDK